jgi:hypothetical protein
LNEKGTLDEKRLKYKIHKRKRESGAFKYGSLSMPIEGARQNVWFFQRKELTNQIKKNITSINLFWKMHVSNHIFHLSCLIDYSQANILNICYCQLCHFLRTQPNF